MATVALFFALSGGALAAKHYLINSTSQINPKVLKKLAGKTGPTGTQGKEGGPGREGSPGKEGPAGKEGKQGVTGPAGSAVAFARVEANGTLDATHSKNIAKAEMSVTAGVYCITPSVQVQSATVSEPHVGGDNGAYAQANIPATGDAATVFCSSPAWVATWKAGGTTLEAHPFYIVFN
jgi:hypothetical protein